MIGEEQIEKRIYQAWKYHSDYDKRFMLYKGKLPQY